MKKILFVLLIVNLIFIFSCSKDLEIIYFEINPTEAEMLVQDELSIKASVSFSGKDSVDMVWDSDNIEIATVNDSGLVKALMPGEATISVKCADQIKKCHVIVHEKTDSVSKLKLFRTKLK